MAGKNWWEGTSDPDGLLDAFTAWADEQQLSLYPHQEEAVMELLAGSNVVLATPPGRASRSSRWRRTAPRSRPTASPSTPRRSRRW
ncbi:hypothetical protein [Nocardioides daphniae]|uniref:hypothetical protein n=1 Tax=Nocardioides daphniae TaxID=402297 RepID=UPI0026B749F9